VNGSYTPVREVVSSFQKKSPLADECKTKSDIEGCKKKEKNEDRSWLDLSWTKDDKGRTQLELVKGLRF
jgi:hypothetical protein